MRNSIRGFYAVFSRELCMAFLSCPLYIGAAVFVFIASVMFFVFGAFFVRGEADVLSFFPVLKILLCVFIPPMTMKVWSDERARHTDTILLTLPISENTLVVAKFCSVLIQFVAVLLLSSCVPLAVARFGAVDVGCVFACYIGLFLFAATLISVGLFLSCWCGNQSVALVFSLLFSVAATTIDAIPRVVSVPTWIATLCSFFSLNVRLSGFFRGIIDSRDIVFFVVATLFFLRGTALVIVHRRCR